MNEIDALRDTYNHIDLVRRYLINMQIEIYKRILTHDMSKINTKEWEGFSESTERLKTMTYGSKEYEESRHKLEETLRHHYAHNRHHPEFFPNGINDMNLIDIIEMLVDWVAATKRHETGNIYHSLSINKERFNIEPQLLNILSNTIPLIQDRFIDMKDQTNV